MAGNKRRGRADMLRADIRLADPDQVFADPEIVAIRQLDLHFARNRSDAPLTNTPLVLRSVRM